MCSKKLLLFAVSILLCGTFCTVSCKADPPDNFLLEPKTAKQFPFLLNSTCIVFGNITSENSNIDFGWTDSENFSVDWHEGDSKGRYNFSFAPEFADNYTLTIFNNDGKSIATIKLFYVIQVLGESDFEAIRSALLNNYDSQTTNHVGYILALVVAIATVFLKADFFPPKKNRWKDLGLTIVFLFLVLLLFYWFLRLVFWSDLASHMKVVKVTDLDLTKYKTIITAVEGAALGSWRGAYSSTFSLQAFALFFYDFGLIPSAFLFAGICLIILVIVVIIWKIEDWRQKRRPVIDLASLFDC